MPTTATEVATKTAELTAQDAKVEALTNEWQALRGPYLAKRQELTAEIEVLEKIDGELELLTADFKAPSPPQPE